MQTKGLTPERTALYRLYDANGLLLYVGASRDPDARWKAHRFETPKPWHAPVASRTDEWLNGREEALVAEAAAIRAERPLFNRTHNYVEVPFDLARWPKLKGRPLWPQLAELIRVEIASGRWSTGCRLPTLEAMASATGMSMRTASKAAVALQREGGVELRPGPGLFVT